MNEEMLRQDLIRDEGLRLKPYRCTAGKLSIGIGRNLDDVGISASEAEYMLHNDILNVQIELDRNLPWWRKMSETRQLVLANMAFNMGIQGTITVNALIDEKGNVLRTEILKGIKNGTSLEKASEDAIKQWKFTPAQKDGVNVKVWKSYDFNFKINSPVKE